jgi:glycosyltransferase involved in cell wall biosynthesis
MRLIGKKRHLPPSDFVLVGYLGQFDVHLARWLFRRRTIILDYMISGADTAKDRGQRGGFKQHLLRRIDNAALRAADIVLVDSEEHRQQLPLHYRKKGLVVNIGAPASWFAANKQSFAKRQSPRTPKVIFFGSFTPLQGTPVIAEALTRVTQPLTVTMLGSGQDLTVAQHAAEHLSNRVELEWRPWLDSNELPALVAQHDICLGIFGNSDKAQRVVPNKVYQGIAAGCAIITSDTPPQRRALGNAAIYVPPGDATTLAQALDDLALNSKKLAQLRQAAHQQAQTFQPAEIVEPLLARLKLPI